MKIALVCPYDMNFHGGVQKIVRESGWGLRRRGHQVSFVSVLNKEGEVTDDCVCFGRAIPIMANGSEATFDATSIFARKELEVFFAREKFDAVCIHEPAVPVLNWEVLSLPGIKKIGWFHMSGFSDMLNFPWGIVMRPLQEWIKLKLDGTIVISPTARRTWRKAFKKNGIIVSGGVDVKKYANAGPAVFEKKARIKVLFVGRLDYRKGVIDLIKAIGRVNKKIEVSLQVVGDGPQKREAVELVESLKLEDRVCFAGRVSDELLPGYYKAADIFCAPAIGGESLGVVLLEAMAAGCPIVAYANPGYKYAMTGYPWTGGLVRPGAGNKLSEAICELASKPELRQEIKGWEKEKVKDYDWDCLTDKFEKYIREICKGT